jgi:hypothetical protein
MDEGRRSKVLFAIAVVIAVLGAVTTRVLVAGEREIAASTAALEAGDAREAVVRARRAAGWYAPGAPHVRLAYERLAALAVAAEDHGQDELAKLAWRAVRSATEETRWIVMPHAADRARADREIARLEAKVPGQRDPDPAIAAAQLQKLAGEDPSRVIWAVALVGGFAIAAFGFIIWSRQAGAAGGEVRGARWGLIVILAGAALWLFAVWRG